MSVRVATFNCENLFARYRFRSNLDPTTDNFTINQLAFDIYEETEKQITAKAIKAVSADIIALQEVESLPVLDRFNSQYLGQKNKYLHRLVIDANDPRGIDVGILSRYEIVHARSHRHLPVTGGSSKLFSRDCLEVGVRVGNKTLTLYINHFKSMMGGRDETHERRKQQAKAVAGIIDTAWRPQNYEGNYIVMGDLNDYEDEHTALKPLLAHEGLDNVVRRLPEVDQWTHYYSKEKQYRQLDYLLLSPSLASHNSGAPEIFRAGLPWRAERVEEDRLDGVGEDNPKASDHCPLYMDIDLH